MEKSSLILSHVTAIEAADLLPPLWEARNPSRTDGPVIPDGATGMGVLPKPWDVTGERRLRHLSLEGCQLHTTLSFSTRRDWSETSDGHRVMSVERAIAAMCVGMSLPRIVRMVDELCGTYRTPRREAIQSYSAAYPKSHAHFLPKDSDAASCKSATFYGLRPVTSVAKLSRFVRAHAGIMGVNKLRRALPFCVDGLRSPLETECYIQLCLPPRLGGMGIPRPQVNQRLGLRKAAREICAKPYIIPDFSWRAGRLALEALGVADHAGDGVTDTSIREKAYKVMGYECVTITMGEERGWATLLASARVLARSLGRRVRTDIAEFEKRRKWLRYELFRLEAAKGCASWRLFSDDLLVADEAVPDEVYDAWDETAGRAPFATSGAGG